MHRLTGEGDPSRYGSRKRRRSVRALAVVTSALLLGACSSDSDSSSASSSTVARANTPATSPATSPTTVEAPVATRPEPAPVWALSDGSTVGQVHVSSNLIVKATIGGNGSPCVIYPGTVLSERSEVHSSSLRSSQDLLFPSCPEGTEIDLYNVASLGITRPFEWNERAAAERAEVSQLLSTIGALAGQSVSVEPSQLTPIDATVHLLAGSAGPLEFDDLTVFSNRSSVGVPKLVMGSPCVLPQGSEVEVLGDFQLDMADGASFGAVRVTDLGRDGSTQFCSVGDVFAIDRP